MLGGTGSRSVAARARALAGRAWDGLRRLLASRAFVPVSAAVACVLLVLTGAQAVRLSGAVGAFGWLTPHDPVTFSGPGLDGAPLGVEAFVLGAVAEPGAYELPAGAQVADLVAAAGGFLPAANAAAVQGDAPLTEGQQVYVPYQGQALSAAGAVLVNLNAASADDLHAALGLTAPIAGRIVAYRDRHGPFTAVSQLLLVPISRTTFDRIKYLVTV